MSGDIGCTGDGCEMCARRHELTRGTRWSPCVMRTLAANLAVAGALEQSFWLGFEYAPYRQTVLQWASHQTWHPGCGRPAREETP